MEQFKKIGLKLLFPPKVLIGVLGIACGGLLVWIFLNGLEASWIAYPIYVLSFYALTSACCWLVPLSIRGIKARKENKAESTPQEREKDFRKSLHQGMAIIRVVQYRKNDHPILGASKNIDLSEAVMSLFALQTSLLAAFGQGFEYPLLMNSLTGGAVCFLAMSGAIGMIFHGKKRKLQLQGEVPMHNQDSFEFTYSAPEQDEIRRIREKYMPPDEREGKLEQLRRLDASVNRKGTYVSITVGTISTLVMGIGMCCCLVWTEYFIPGIFIGILGMTGIGAAFPLYHHIIKTEQARIAPQILKLTDELMQ